MSYWHLLATWKGRISFLNECSYCQVNHNPVEDNTFKNILRPQFILEDMEGSGFGVSEHHKNMLEETQNSQRTDEIKISKQTSMFPVLNSEMVG